MYKVLAFDFDGVISQYSGKYVGDAAHGEPIQETLTAMRLLREQGYKIIIYSTKSTPTLKAYCDLHGVPYDWINENPEMEQGNPGKPRAGIYIDDHALRFRGQNAAELVRDVQEFEQQFDAERKSSKG